MLRRRAERSGSLRSSLRPRGPLSWLDFILKKMDAALQQQIRALTGIRGVAAVWVVIYHMTRLNHDNVSGPFGAFVERGYLAIDLFFVLSGFVMSSSSWHLFAPGYGVRHYATFMLRRIARIYPLYLAVTLLVAALTLSGISRDVPIYDLGFRLAVNLTMIQAWGVGESLNGPAWSISTEFAAYLVFPWLLSAVIRSSKLVAVTIALLCLGVILCLTTAVRLTEKA